MPMGEVDFDTALNGRLTVWSLWHVRWFSYLWDERIQFGDQYRCMTDFVEVMAYKYTFIAFITAEQVFTQVSFRFCHY